VDDASGETERERLLAPSRIYVEPAAAELPRGRQVLRRRPRQRQRRGPDRPFAGQPTAKASFATKYVNRGLLDLSPRGRTRVRFSLMPARAAKVLDLRTSPILDRLRALDDFVEAGYEVLWRPDLQETKRSEGGGINVRYRAGHKRALLDELLDLIAVHAPYLRVRYAF
jgi:hypothetical protein